MNEAQSLNINIINSFYKTNELRAGLLNYLSNADERNNKVFSTVLREKNPVEKFYENFLLKYNPKALLEKYITKASVKKMLDKSPVVSEILENKGAKAVPCFENIKNIENSHIKTTVEFALGIAQLLKLSNEDKNIIAMGALFHDLGKIMISPDLINKHGSLTPEERRIVDTHGKIGYEMLKTTGMDSKVLTIVKNHHKAASMTNDYRTKIVSVADVYSALTEKRAYKDCLSTKQAFEIMKSFVDNNCLDGEFVAVLKSYLKFSSK